MRIAVAAGVDSIEHGDSIRPEVAEEMARKGIYLCPTQTVLYYFTERTPPDEREESIRTQDVAAKSIANCRKAGVKIAFGTDAGGFPWTEVNQAREFELEVQLGMTPIEAIRSATTVAGELLGLSGRIGTVEKGAYADLIAVPGDPLQDVSVLNHVEFVMKAGTVIKTPSHE